MNRLFRVTAVFLSFHIGISPWMAHGDVLIIHARKTPAARGVLLEQAVSPPLTFERESRASSAWQWRSRMGETLRRQTPFQGAGFEEWTWRMKTLVLAPSLALLWAAGGWKGLALTLIAMAMTRMDGQGNGGETRAAYRSAPTDWNGFDVQLSVEFAKNIGDYSDQMRFIIPMLQRLGGRLNDPDQLISDTMQRSVGLGVQRLRRGDRRLYFSVSKDTRVVTLLAYRVKHEVAGKSKSFLLKQRETIFQDPERAAGFYRLIFPEGALVAEDPLLLFFKQNPGVFGQIHDQILRPLQAAQNIDAVAKLLYDDQADRSRRILLGICNELIMAVEESHGDTDTLCVTLFGRRLDPVREGELRHALGGWISQWRTTYASLTWRIDFAFDLTPNVIADPLRYLFHRIESEQLRDFLIRRMERWATWRQHQEALNAVGQSIMRASVSSVYGVMKSRMEGEEPIEIQSPSIEAILTPVSASQQIIPLESVMEVLGARVPSGEERAGPGSPSTPRGETAADPRRAPAASSGETALPEGSEIWVGPFGAILTEAGLPTARQTPALLLGIHHAMSSNHSSNSKRLALKDALDKAKWSRKEGEVGKLVKRFDAVLEQPRESTPVLGGPHEPTEAELQQARKMEVHQIFYPLAEPKEVVRRLSVAIHASWAAIQSTAQHSLGQLGIDETSRVFEVGMGGRGILLHSLLNGAKALGVQREEEPLDQYRDRLKMTEEFKLSVDLSFTSHSHGIERSWQRAVHAAKEARFVDYLARLHGAYERFRPLLKGHADLLLGDAASPDIQAKIRDWTNKYGKFTHLVAVGVVGETSLEVESPDITADEPAVASLYHLLADLADPAGAVIYSSPPAQSHSPKLQPYDPIVDPDLLEILKLRGWIVRTIEKVATPTSLGVKRGSLLRIVKDPDAPAWAPGDELTLPSMVRVRDYTAEYDPEQADRFFKTLLADMEKARFEQLPKKEKREIWRQEAMAKRERMLEAETPPLEIAGPEAGEKDPEKGSALLGLAALVPVIAAGLWAGIWEFIPHLKMALSASRLPGPTILDSSIFYSLGLLSLGLFLLPGAGSRLNALFSRVMARRSA